MFKQLLSVFLQSHCAFCNRPTANTLCQYCFVKLSSHELNKSDRVNFFQRKSVFAWGHYDRQLKRAIAQMKYHNHPEIGEILGVLLAKVWLQSNLIEPQRKITVIPIPLHSKKLKERGFNQAELIARSFCQITGYRLNSRALIRNRETKAMFEFKSLAQRAKNLEGAFGLKDKLPQHPILIIDDIYTTGTTVQESIRVLKQKKLKVIGVAVAAQAGAEKLAAKI